MALARPATLPSFHKRSRALSILPLSIQQNLTWTGHSFLKPNHSPKMAMGWIQSVDFHIGRGSEAEGFCTALCSNPSSVRQTTADCYPSDIPSCRDEEAVKVSLSVAVVLVRPTRFLRSQNRIPLENDQILHDTANGSSEESSFYTFVILRMIPPGFRRDQSAAFLSLTLYIGY
jgi:hypothetical protein